MKSKLGEVCEIKYGKDHKRLADGNIPVYGSGGIMRYADTALYNKKSVLIPRKGTLRNLFFVNTPFWTVDTLFYTQVNEAVIIPEFLYYQLSTLDLAGMNVGTAVPSLTTAVLNELEIEVPPLGEQKAIADTLSSLDAKIANNTKINHHLEQIAQAIFKSWVEGCADVTTVGDVVENTLDYTPNKNNPVILVNSGDVHNGHFTHHTLSANEDLKGHFKKRFSKGDILYSEIRPRNKHFSFVSFEADKYIASTRLMVLRNKPDSIFASILYQHLKSDAVIEQFATMTETRSGTFPQGCFADLASIEIAISSLDKQREVGGFLDSILLTVAGNDEKSAHLVALRNSLLPRLMSGKLSVADFGDAK